MKRTASILLLSLLTRKIPLTWPTIGGGGGAGSSRADYDRGERYLHDLAELTGGRVYQASKDLNDLEAAFIHIADELGRQYSIGYYPQRKGQMGERRQIKVRVSRTAAVRCRDNYVYKGPTDMVPNATSASEQRQQTQSPPVMQKKPFVSDLKAQQ